MCLYEILGGDEIVLMHRLRLMPFLECNCAIENYPSEKTLQLRHGYDRNIFIAIEALLCLFILHCTKC